MDEMERLRAELGTTREQVLQLQRQLEQAQQRLTLSDQERAVLAGKGDGCVRLGDLRPIVRRVFGDAA
jgi:hypothetical protein